jgi:hypothetical protein
MKGGNVFNKGFLLNVVAPQEPAHFSSFIDEDKKVLND